MNIFILDMDHDKCAAYHNNKHVVKMILEQTQILSACHHIHNSEQAKNLYRLTHAKHPCVKWACESSANYEWLYNLTVALMKEYTFRYGKTHACERLLPMLNNNPCPKGCLTPFAQAMPYDVKHSDPVIAYRNYYIKYKGHLAEWKNRSVPEWYK